MKKHVILFLAILISCQFTLLAKNIVTTDDMLEKCRDYIVEQTGHSEDKLIISTDSRLHNIEVPEGKTSLRVYGDIEKGLLGRLPLKLAIYSGDELYKVMYVLFEVDLKTQVFVTKRWIKREEFFSPENLMPLETEQSSVPADYVKDMDDLEGKVSKVALPKGRIITYHHLEEPSVVKRGQIVRLVASAPNMDIETKGKALKDGKEGDVIKVENIDSGKIIYGKIVDRNTVVVNLY